MTSRFFLLLIVSLQISPLYGAGTELRFIDGSELRKLDVYDGIPRAFGEKVVVFPDGGRPDAVSFTIAGVVSLPAAVADYIRTREYRIHIHFNAHMRSTACGWHKLHQEQTQEGFWCFHISKENHLAGLSRLTNVDELWRNHNIS